MERRTWRFRPFDEGVVERIESACQVDPLVARLLVCRGLQAPAECRDFLENRMTGLLPPEQLPGCDAAVDRLLRAIEQQEKIAIYGDYDADGMTSTAILWGALKRAGADLTFHVPNRLDDGYGLNAEALSMLAERGCRVVITVDCGISSLDHARHARDVGIDLIVTDHHELASELPAAVAVVHPRLPGSNYPCGDLCGAGVAFKVAWRLLYRAGGADPSGRVAERFRDYIFRALALAAIGTVADVVPLRGENRVIVAHGLARLREFAPIGLKHLMTVAKLDEKSSLESEDIAFSLGPRLNAAGRLGQAPLGVELLTTDNDERGESLARYLDQLNGNRDSLERSILKRAQAQIKESFDGDSDPAFVLADRDWHAGVIGVVAGRLAEKLHRPVVLVSLDPTGVKPGIGSARAGSLVDLHGALVECAEHLVSYGGHQAAAGMRVTEENIDSFRAAFVEAVATQQASLPTDPILEIDLETPLAHLNLSAMNQLERMSPFGQGNPRPLLCARRVELAEPPKRIGAGERHLAIRLRQFETTIRGVAFGRGEWADELQAVSGPIDVAFRPVINEFRGRRNVEIHLVDWRAAE